MRRTHAERVVETYREMIRRYPTPEDLSRADAQKLRKIFSSLGLFRRADVFIEAAKKIVREYGGRIPNNISQVSTLPGMGIYSSRAVVCLAFGEPVPMIDESSGRLTRRVLNLEGRSPAYSDKKLLRIAVAIIPVQFAREFNLGLLDIASAFCHHDIPDCSLCPLTKVCAHYNEIMRP